MRTVTVPGSDTAPSSRLAWYIVGILAIANLLSYIDRQVLAVLIGQIRHAFLITDTQFSLLQGAAFTVFFCIAAVPVGHLVDRANRGMLLAAGMVLWSVATISSGLATSFAQLLIARAFVGIGEAVLLPVAYSLISEYFSANSLAKPLSVFSGAMYLGTGIAWLVGGAALAAFHDVFAVTVPVFGEMAIYRVVFFIVGLPGLLLAGLVLASVRDPRRAAVRNGDSGSGASGEKAELPAKAFLKFARLSSWALLSVYVVSALFTFVTFNVAPWTPALYMRRFHMTASQAGLSAGLSGTIAGTLGCLFSGWLCDRWTALGGVGRKFGVPFLSICVMVPSLAGTVLLPVTPALICSGVFIFANALGFVGLAAALQDIVPGNFRGSASALLLIVNGIVGLTLGTSAVAIVTDHVLHNDALLGYSMLIVSVPVSVIALIVSAASLKSYSRRFHELHSHLASGATGGRDDDSELRPRSDDERDATSARRQPTGV